MKTIGIIGGGQLALMLTQAAQNLGHKVHLLAQSYEPAASAADKTFSLNATLDTDVTDFLNSCDVATIESEFVEADIIASALLKTQKRVPFTPLPKSIKIAQDKLSQKELFSRLHVPTAKHREITHASLAKYFDLIWEEFPKGVVLKWSKFGYDGKGNFVLKTPQQVESAKRFCEAAFARGHRVYCEELIEFSHELAMIFVRTASGLLLNYPLVISEQENGICKLVYGPATKLGIPHKVESEAAEIGRAVGEALLLTGTYALEFFYTAQGRLFVNEMAPRVHNSGHYSLNAADCSQFENHIHITTGTAPKQPTFEVFFGMLNLLGPQGLSLNFQPGWELPRPLSRDLFPYWYRKLELKPGRKMGHINTRAQTKEELFERVNLMKSYEDSLWKSLSQR